MPSWTMWWVGGGERRETDHGGQWRGVKVSAKEAARVEVL